MWSVRNAVPYHSQHDTSIPDEWRKRSCGVTALWMALTHNTKTGVPTVAALIEEGVASGAYLPNVGWRHDGLVALAKAHGKYAWRREFRVRARSRLPKVLIGAFNWFLLRWGMYTLVRAIRAGVVPIVSVTVPDKEDTHLMPLVGFSKEHGTHVLYYHEPAALPETQDGAGRSIELSEFMRRWRRLALFVR